MSGYSGRERWLFTLILGVCLVAYLANLHCLPIGETVDDGVYVSVGKALASGLGYVRSEDPAHPPETRYPAGLPLTVALLWKLSGGNLAALRLIPLLFTVASLFLAVPVLRRRLPLRADGSPDRPWLWMLLALFGLNHYLVPHAGILMAEPAFLCLTLAAIVWMDRHEAQAPRDRKAWWAWAVGMALVIAAAALFRSAGYVILVACGLWLWQRRERRLAVVVVALTVVLLLPWLVTQHRASGAWLGRGYTTAAVRSGEMQWSPLLRPVENLVLYGTARLPEAVVPFLGERVGAVARRLGVPFAPPLLGALFSLLLLWGAVLHARSRPDPATWIAAGTAGLLLLWPYPHARLLIPVIPLLLIYLLSGARRLCGRRTYLVWVAAALTLSGCLARDVVLVAHPLREKVTDLRALARFVDDHTPPGAVVIAPNSAGLGLYAHRGLMDPLPTSGFAVDTSTPAPVQWVARLAAYRPAFVMLYPLQTTDPLVSPPECSRPPFHRVAGNEGLRTTLYEIR